MPGEEKPQIIITDPTHVAISRINKAIWAIISILVIGFITMLLMVAGIVLDAWRYKSNSYDGLIETIRGQEQMLRNYQAERDEMKILLRELGNKIDKSVSSKK